MYHTSLHPAVLYSLAVTRDQAFRAVSVTAEQWLPLQEVPPASLAGYLQDRRRAGYTIVAVEQASDSVSLHQFTFPRQCVLLLGRWADWTETCHMSISQGTRGGSCGSPELGGHLCRGAVITDHERQVY